MGEEKTHPRRSSAAPFSEPVETLTISRSLLGLVEEGLREIVREGETLGRFDLAPADGVRAWQGRATAAIEACDRTLTQEGPILQRGEKVVRKLDRIEYHFSRFSIKLIVAGLFNFSGHKALVPLLSENQKWVGLRDSQEQRRSNG